MAVIQQTDLIDQARLTANTGGITAVVGGTAALVAWRMGKRATVKL